MGEVRSTLGSCGITPRISFDVGNISEVDQQNPRAAALMGNLAEIRATRKMISLLFISIRSTDRKTLLDKFSKINILLIDLKTFVQNCAEYFQTRRNRTLDQHILLSRKQKPNETLHQFRNILNGLAARCEFRNQTDGLVHDIVCIGYDKQAGVRKTPYRIKRNAHPSISICHCI